MIEIRKNNLFLLFNLDEDVKFGVVKNLSLFMNVFSINRREIILKLLKFINNIIKLYFDKKVGKFYNFKNE